MMAIPLKYFEGKSQEEWLKLLEIMDYWNKYLTEELHDFVLQLLRGDNR
jgi:plasmid maintenance system antidote protein VapI